MASTLVLAVGNESRGDDALGPLLLRRLAGWLEVQPRHDVEFIEEFQLQVEHTLDIAGRTRVLFVDAAANLVTPFTFTPAVAEPGLAHTSHALTPAALLGVYRRVHGEPPPSAWVLGIAGRSFELGEPLSAEAALALDAAFPFACQLLEADSDWDAASRD